MALAITLSGALVLTIGGRDVQTTPQSVVLMPANVPHAVRAIEPARMLLIMLREHEQEPLKPAQGAHDHEAKEYDLPLVRQGRA